MKKSQISLEFVMLISLVFLVFIGFMALMQNQFSQLNEEEDYSSMYNIANLIKNEVLIASKVHDNYIRKFEMPLALNGKDYTVDLQKDVLTIKITGEDSSVTVILPVQVKGGFIEKNEAGQMEHCITKNQHDGVRIARNQASIELEENANLKDIDNDGILEINSENEFSAYVRMNCIDNIQQVAFSLQLTNVNYLGYELIYQYNEFGVLQTQFVNPFFYREPDRDSIFREPSGSYLTFTIPQKSGQASSGSGNVIKLRLKASSGLAKIEFVPDTISLMDNTATYLTKEALPSSNIPAEIEII